MNCGSHLADLLPAYAAGTLGGQERRALEEHLTACPECREALALWRDIGAAVTAEAVALPAPSPALVDGALAKARRQRPGAVAHAEARRQRPGAVAHAWVRRQRPGAVAHAEARRQRPGAVAHAWALLRAQVPLVRGEIWPASALVMGLGYVVSLIAGRSDAGGVIQALAPLVAAGGLAMIYGPENDPSLELTLATPTSPRQVLLARLALVFGYNLLLALAASAGLLALVPPHLLGGIILGWLGPMAFLSALALVLSLCIGTGNAVSVAFMLWLARGLAGNLYATDPGGLEATFGSAALAYLRAWQSPALLFGLAAALVAAAVWLAGRQEPLLMRGA